MCIFIGVQINEKTFLVILKVLIGIVGIYFLIFLFYPSSVLDFYIYPKDPLEYSNLKEIFLKIKPFGFSFQITHTGRHKSNLEWSPNKKYVAFYENAREPTDESFDREWALKIIHPRTLRIKTVFIGDYHTSNYQWIDNKTIRVYVNAGSGVKIYRDIDIKISQPFVASEHLSPEFWTPMVQN